jgi:MOSC domain-containing protein YiiM
MAGNRDRWPLAGDQIYVDMDISTHNLPPGTRLSLGEAVIEISDMPHNGCPKFAARFGKDALRFANVGVGKEKRFRGVYARVVEGGTISTGDEITRG